jgi:putative (di)nucleoside polyphosphate hydrolase
MFSPLATLPPQDTAHEGYRPCVGIMLMNAKGLVFAGRRRKEGGPEHVSTLHAWQMPQGGVDQGEDAYVAALRELYEETNVSSVTLLAQTPFWYAYDLPAAITKKSWRGRYRGQTQKWFAFSFKGNDTEIDIHQPGGGVHKSEFDDWRWVPMTQLVNLIIPFKRGVYEQVIAHFAHLSPTSGENI